MTLHLETAALSHLRVTTNKYGALEASVTVHFAPDASTVRDLVNLMPATVALDLTAVIVQATLTLRADPETGEVR